MGFFEEFAGKAYQKAMETPEWAKGYEGVISLTPREGYEKADLKDLGYGNFDGTYYVESEFLKQILQIENLKDKRGSGGVFYDHDEL